MNNGWVKLYRKTNDKGFMKDHLAFILFSWLLINADREGKRRLGRYTVCDELGINPNTYYKILKRLEKKWNVIKIKSTKLYSTVFIVNWGKYQHEENTGDNQETISVQLASTQQTTKQEYKNTRIQEDYITPFLDKFNTFFNSSYRPTKARTEKLRLRLKTYSFDELSCALENMARQPFYKGENDRRWKADPDFFLRSDEQIDKFLNLQIKESKSFVDQIMEEVKSGRIN